MKGRILIGGINRMSDAVRSSVPVHPVRCDWCRYGVMRPRGILREIPPLRQLRLRHQQEDRHSDFLAPSLRALYDSVTLRSQRLSTTSKLRYVWRSTKRRRTLRRRSHSLRVNLLPRVDFPAAPIPRRLSWSKWAILTRGWQCESRYRSYPQICPAGAHATQLQILL